MVPEKRVFKYLKCIYVLDGDIKRAETLEANLGLMASSVLQCYEI